MGGAGVDVWKTDGTTRAVALEAGGATADDTPEGAAGLAAGAGGGVRSESKNVFLPGRKTFPFSTGDACEGVDGAVAVAGLSVGAAAEGVYELTVKERELFRIVRRTRKNAAALRSLQLRPDELEALAREVVPGATATVLRLDVRENALAPNRVVHAERGELEEGKVLSARLESVDGQIRQRTTHLEVRVGGSEAGAEALVGFWGKVRDAHRL